MSALALILVSRGYSVSGSDQALKKDLETLVKKGITVFQSQNKKNIDEICQYKTLKPLIIISTAIPNNNSELMAAQKANLKILHRSDLLATLIEQQKSILVAGTHGKTTTSTILSTLLALTEVKYKLTILESLPKSSVIVS